MRAEAECQKRARGCANGCVSKMLCACRCTDEWATHWVHAVPVEIVAHRCDEEQFFAQASLVGDKPFDH